MIKFLTLLIPILSFYYICVEAQNSAGNLPFSTTECGQTKGCMFHPDNCIPFVNCVHATSYSLNGNQVVFELLTMLRSPTNQWVGIGFNNAPQMDGSTVTACASFNGGPYSTALSYNPAMYNLNAPIDQVNMFLV
uniref:DOMON domain-containing protein n=1 Tax=Acrobeloides nanus TaxID=290746 RepID=A0A914EJ40_9BILA